MSQFVFAIFDNRGAGVTGGTITVDGQPVDVSAGSGISFDVSPGTAHAVHFHDPSGRYQDVSFNFVPITLPSAIGATFNPVYIACYPKGASVPPQNALGAIQVHVVNDANQPLANATVAAGTLTKQTDANGNALFQLPQNAYGIVASMQGYVPAAANIVVSAISTPQNPAAVQLTLVRLQVGQPQPPVPPPTVIFPPGTGAQPPITGGGVGPGGGPAVGAASGRNALVLALGALAAAAIAFAPEDLLA